MVYHQKQMKNVLIVFGGVSPEHEVSVITGLQVLEHIDRTLYRPYPVHVTKNGEFRYLPRLNDRRQFLHTAGKSVSWGVDPHGGFMRLPGLLRKKIYPVAAYLAFHGGSGEGGHAQGFFETLGIPFTSPDQEASVLTMNKQLTKQVAGAAGIPTVPGMTLFSSVLRTDVEPCARAIVVRLGLPVIIKPVHLGSSIGIKIARTNVELQKFLLEASHIDKEILVEKYLSSFVEYNCAVRSIDRKVEVSAIERPFSKGEILSFADKYQRGGKKSGGMASSQRELPARIDLKLERQIQRLAKSVFVACRCRGMARVDFMYTAKKKLYLTEINPIPGSMAFYLWEAAGISFKQQISDLIEQAIRDAEQAKIARLEYETDIIEKFVKQPKASQ